MNKLYALSFLALLSSSARSQELELRYNKPAGFFEEALVIGNGSLGATVYGGYTTDKISLNDITLWTGEPDRTVYSPEAYKALPAIRKALDEEDYKEADELQKAVQGHYTENYQPLGTLTIEYVDADFDPGSDKHLSQNDITGYSRTLDISRAVARTVYRRGGGGLMTSEYFASAPDSVIVIHLKAESVFSAVIRLESQLPHTTVVRNNEIISDGYAAYHSYPNYVRNEFLYDENRGIHYRTIVKVLADNRFYAEGETIRLRNNSDVMIIIANATSFNGFDKDPVKEGRDYRTIVRRIVDKAAKEPVFALKERHVKDYQRYFNRVMLNLGKTDEQIASLPTDEQLYNYTKLNQRNPELEALYFQFGRYLLISSSRTPGVPANLQGLWNEKILPPWSCNYTSNINLEENYWPAETANLSEMHLPMLSFLKNLSSTGSTSAKEYYGASHGWSLSHNTDIWAMTCPVGLHSGSPSWANWNMGGAWTSTHIWEHYAFSKDRKFLMEYYPVLKGAAEFCLDWLIEKDGCLMTSPSTSPENIYTTDNGYQGATLYGGTADVAMIRECLVDTKKAAEELSTDADLCARIDSVVARLLPYRIGKRGNLQEWYHDWNDQDPHHRHQSHLFGLYPGHQFDGGLPYQNYSTEELKAACAKTLEIKGDNSTGWSTGWRVNLYARLRDSAGAYHIYRKLLRYVSPDGYSGERESRGGGTYPNLLDAHSPFQIDGNFGGCAGVAEMLIQSTTESVTLLPALPEAWKSGEVKGLRARGGFEVDMTWRDGKVSLFTISSTTGGSTTIYYNGTKKKVTLKNNGKRTIKG